MFTRYGKIKSEGLERGFEKMAERTPLRVDGDDFFSGFVYQTRSLNREVLAECARSVLMRAQHFFDEGFFGTPLTPLVWVWVGNPGTCTLGRSDRGTTLSFGRRLATHDLAPLTRVFAAADRLARLREVDRLLHRKRLQQASPLSSSTWTPHGSYP